MRTREAVKAAEAAGRDVGQDAASRTCDGNTPREWYEKTLRGIEEGDPAILDIFRLPDLSGEFAGDPTPESLAEEYGLRVNRSSSVADAALAEVCEAWETGVHEAFWDGVTELCRAALREEAM